MDEKKIEAILRHYSAEAQKIKSIEELAELQTEIARDLNHQGDIRSITGRCVHHDRAAHDHLRHHSGRT